MERGKICGFRQFDKVKYFGKKYFILGKDTHLGRAKCTMKMELDTQNKKVDNMNFSYSVEP